MAQRFGCKWQNYHNIQEKWMQISLLNFDSKWEKKENLFSITDIVSCSFSLIREGDEAFLFMLNLFLVVVDTISFKYVFFLKTFISQLRLELWWKKRFSGIHSRSDGFLPLGLFFPSCSFWPYEGFSIKESKTFVLLQSPLLVKAACLFFSSSLILCPFGPFPLCSLQTS